MTKITRVSTLLEKARDEIQTSGRCRNVLMRKNGAVCAVGAVYKAAGIPTETLVGHDGSGPSCDERGTWPTIPSTATQAIELLDTVTCESFRIKDAWGEFAKYDGIIELNDTTTSTKKVLSVFNAAIDVARKREQNERQRASRKARRKAVAA